MSKPSNGAGDSAATTTTGTTTSEPTIILEEGDFVRVSDRGFHEVKRLRDRSDDLGRILKVYKETDNDGDLCVFYDVDWPVVGGTLPHVADHFLRKTSAVEEGLTATQRRETRKPKVYADTSPRKVPNKQIVKPDDNNKKKTSTKASGKGVVPTSKKFNAKVTIKSTTSKKAATNKAPTTTTTATKKKPAQKAASSAAKRKANTEANSTSGGKKRKAAAASPAPAVEPEEPDEGMVPRGMDLYEKQRREFDRVMTRLEKIDPFGWFWDPVPAEYDEKYNHEAPADSNDASQSNDASGEVDTKTQQVHPVYPEHGPYNWEMIRRRKESGRYVLDRVSRKQEEHAKLLAPYHQLEGKEPQELDVNPRVLYPHGVHWKLFQEDVMAMIQAAHERTDDPTFGAHTSLEVATKKLREALDQAVERIGGRHDRELSYYDDRRWFDSILRNHSNTEAAMQSWRRTPFPERRYERLKTDVVSAGLSELDERTASYELKTSIPDSFIGMSYRYDDTGQSEAWMQSVVDDAGAKTKTKGDRAKEAAMALAADKGVVRAQVVATMQSLLIGVQDRVMTENSVLNQSELASANWLQSNDLESSEITAEIVEQPVWGIDCYTRKNLLICLEAEFDPQTALEFVEKWLLPAINACPPDIANDISNAARILEGLPFQKPSEEDRIDKLIEEQNESRNLQQWSNTILGNALVNKINSQGPPWLQAAANTVRRARESLGPNFFRVHPKGHGSVLLCPRAKANRLVTFYRGEIYPAWRWGEKMDAIEITQQRKGLRPVLPDFYNMALERPQSDPRGYGLLFVDASRKGGHGSALSHSCQPTCEVRVTAKNGGLSLAMVTLRELEMGEELTFDYNAATDSLNEYHSAVCLCGHGKCRGSFLHLATADCYQKVMNRNSPIASRFSNLIKGCMKKVMSEDDEKVLNSHGFRTASFGAISVNRHDAESSNNDLSDTMDIVPVWLKTYAADTLRYIEYERRALPITLLIDQMPSESAKVTSNAKGEKNCTKATAPKKKSNDGKKKLTSKKGSKEPTQPVGSFFYFSSNESDRILASMSKNDLKKTGLELQNAKQRAASDLWKSMSDEQKAYWKEEAAKDFARKKRKWRAEQASMRRKEKLKSAPPKEGSLSIKDLSASKIGFQDADAEGISAMEHRIQHLTQTLSRVGRVLDRDRETKLEETKAEDLHDSMIRDVAHPPLKVLEDPEVISRIWLDSDSVVNSLERFMNTGKCVPLKMRLDFVELARQYQSDLTMNSRDDRETLKRGLLEIRSLILKHLQKMQKCFRKYKSLLSTEKDSDSLEDVVRQKVDEPPPAVSEDQIALNQEARDSSETGNEDTVTPVGDTMTDAIPEAQNPDSLAQSTKAIREVNGIDSSPGDSQNSVHGSPGETSDDGPGYTEIRQYSDRKSDTIDGNSDMPTGEGQPASRPTTPLNTPSEEVDKGEDVTEEGEESVLTSTKILASNPWIDHYGERASLEAAADLLLLYANTSNFFVLNPYTNLESTPIEVYARELGNAVPKSAIDEELLSASDAALLQSSNVQTKGKSTAADDAFLCSPDDVVAKVNVKYNGDYVLSQLLQWYNGGIGQKPGLPDLSGCVTLPPIAGCWLSPLIPQKKIITDRKTLYDAKIRQQLIEWLQDPFKRGSPLSGDVKKAFYSQSPDDIPASRVLFGSPILDFLVTGDESNIYDSLEELDTENKVSARASANNALSTVDRGRPAQAVCRWVQCEKPNCLKWRKIPWHVDIDLLPEVFVCEDNKWDPASANCDALEDDWDVDDKLVGADGKVDESPTRKKGTGPALPTREKDFRVGAKFDVLRKRKFTVGTVTHIDFSGKLKRVRFHFRRTTAEADEWIEFGSDRIAVLHSKTEDPKRKREQAEASGASKPNMDGATATSTEKEKQGGKKEVAIAQNEKMGGSSIPNRASHGDKALPDPWTWGGDFPSQKIAQKKRKNETADLGNGESRTDKRSHEAGTSKTSKKVKKKKSTDAAVTLNVKETDRIETMETSDEAGLHPYTKSTNAANLPKETVYGSQQDSYTPDTSTSHPPRQVTVEKTNLYSSHEVESSKVPLSSSFNPPAPSDNSNLDVLIQASHLAQPYETTRPSSSADNMPPNLHNSSLGIPSGMLDQQFISQSSQPSITNDLRLLSALSMGNLGAFNGYQGNQPPPPEPDIQSLLRRAGSDPAALLQLHQLLQNSGLYRR